MMVFNRALGNCSVFESSCRNIPTSSGKVMHVRHYDSTRLESSFFVVRGLVHVNTMYRGTTPTKHGRFRSKHGLVCNSFLFCSSLRRVSVGLWQEDIAYSVAVLELQKLRKTLVFVHSIEICRYTTPKHSTLQRFSDIDNWFCIQRCLLTSAEHLATASANFSIGLVLPGIFDCGLQKI